MTPLNVQRSAEIIRCHPESLRKWIREGKVKAFRNELGYYFLLPREVLRLRDKQLGLRDAQNGRRLKMEDDLGVGHAG